MTAKAEVLVVVNKLPDSVRFEEIIRQIELLAANRESQKCVENVAAETALQETPTLYKTKSAKLQVLKSVGKIQNDATYEDITGRIRVLAAIQEGLDSLDQGEGVPIEEVEKMVASWITK
jgi:hypothetical protein